MDAKTYKALAEEWGQDTYGDIFSESGWGICFAFDIAQALYAYCTGYYNGDGDPLYACLCMLSRSPIDFRPGMGGGFNPDEKYDEKNDEKNDEYETTRQLYNNMVENKNWGSYYETLLWFCRTDEKERKANHG
jgi:hypothetical protein